MIVWIRLKEKVRRPVLPEEGASGHVEGVTLCMRRCGDEEQLGQKVEGTLALRTMATEVSAA